MPLAPEVAAEQIRRLQSLPGMPKGRDGRAEYLRIAREAVSLTHLSSVVTQCVDNGTSFAPKPGEFRVLLEDTAHNYRQSRSGGACEVAGCQGGFMAVWLVKKPFDKPVSRIDPEQIAAQWWPEVTRADIARQLGVNTWHAARDRIARSWAKERGLDLYPSFEMCRCNPGRGAQ